MNDLKESEIRPENLIRENDDLWAEDIKKMLSDKDSFVNISCPSCESSGNRFLFEKAGFTFVACSECQTVFVNPRPSLDVLMEFYTTAKSLTHYNEKIFPATEDVRRNEIFGPRARMVADICSRHKIETGSILDVGAGFGTFCEEIKKLSNFEEVIAVEPSGSLAETCRKKGIKVIEKPIERVSMDGIVDVITSFELIEHLFWPKDFLLACRKVLKKLGLLIITTPNIKGFDLLILGSNSDNIIGPQHLNYFTPHSAIHLLEKSGFKVIDWSTPGKLDVDIVKNQIMNNYYEISCPFLKNIFVDGDQKVHDAFQEFLTNSKLSSHLLIVAQKI